MEPFSIIFVKGKGIISRIIKLFSKKYSHCELVLDQFHTLSTDWKYSLRVKHLDLRSSEYDVKRLKISLTEEQKEKIIQFYHKEMRRRYDWEYLLYRLLFILFRVKIKNEKHKYTCDEVIVEAFKGANIKLVDDDIILTPTSLSESKMLEDANK